MSGLAMKRDVGQASTRLREEECQQGDGCISG